MAAGVIYVAQRKLNAVGESENEFPASAVISKSVVRENTTPSLQVRTFSLPTDASISDIQMLDAMNGWVWCDDRELYKTSDGGEHWTRVPLNLPARSSITDAYFLNRDVGWITVSRTVVGPDEAEGPGSYEDATWIFETRDGGKTLSERSTIKYGQITEIEFVDEREGWATGRMLSRGYPERNASLVLHTTTGGKDWQNLSAKLPASEGVEGLHLIGPRAAVLLTDDGAVNKTVNEGETWTRVDKLTYENDQFAIWGFELGKDNRLMIVGGASSEWHGTHGMLATKDERQNWIVHEVANIHLTDAMFLSDSEVLACGSLLVELSKFQPYKPEVREAVLLYSPDKGKTWTILSRYPQSKFLTALAITDTNEAMAVGSRGLVFKIKLPLDRIPVSARNR